LICNSCISEDSSQIFPISLVKIGRLLTDRNFRGLSLRQAFRSPYSSMVPLTSSFISWSRL
jgi:hypothetical protein